MATNCVLDGWHKELHSHPQRRDSHGVRHRLLLVKYSCETTSEYSQTVSRRHIHHALFNQSSIAMCIKDVNKYVAFN